MSTLNHFIPVISEHESNSDDSVEVWTGQEEGIFHPEAGGSADGNMYESRQEKSSEEPQVLRETLIREDADTNFNSWGRRYQL